MESGMAPDGAMHLDPLPVDFVSQAMIWLSVGGGLLPSIPIRTLSFVASKTRFI